MATGRSDNAFVIIGAGHMGAALADGLVRSGIRRSAVTLIDKGDSLSPVVKARFVFLAVKPSVVPEALLGIRHLLSGKVLVSVAAGVPIAALRKNLDAGTAVARIMPNIPVAVGEGVIGFFGAGISAGHRALLMKALSGLGLVIEAKKEKDLDVLTLVSGCGPGVVSYLIGAVAAYAKKLGLSEKESKAVSLQTFKGTLAYLLHARVAPSELAASVATKGGVTEAILSTLDANGFRKDFERAMGAGAGKLGLKARR